MRHQNLSYAVAVDIDLHRAVVITEAIRAITDAARQVNMAALNARLLSRRSGDEAVGFGVTSNSLRGFAATLSADMDELIVRTSCLVGDIAFLQRHRMRTDRLRRGLEGCKNYRHDACQFTLRYEEMETTALREIQQSCMRIHRSVLRSIKLCDMGVSLSRSATIEAVHGGAMAVSLKQVSSEIVMKIEDIRKNLKIVRKAITEE